MEGLSKGKRSIKGEKGEGTTLGRHDRDYKRFQAAN